MKILIASIGKFKRNDYENLLINEYLERMNGWKVEFANSAHMESKAVESSSLIDLCKSRYLIALDPNGREMSSQEFAEFFAKLQLKSLTNIAFAIGGAYGHDDLLLKKSNVVLSLSKMTFAHKIAKMVLVEQIYRAYTILQNHPYHK